MQERTPELYQMHVSSGLVNDLSEYERLLLRMEDRIEERIEIDKEACADLDKDWKGLYAGECASCGRVYEAAYLVDLANSSTGRDCIPCWREKNDLAKIDRDHSEHVAR